MLIFSNEQAIYGAFKASGTKDPDVILTVKETMMSTAIFFKIIPYPLIGMGIILCLTLFGILIGIILIGLGIFLNRKYKSFQKKVDNAYQRYLNDTNV